MSEYNCKLKEVVDEFDLRLLNTKVDYNDIVITTRDINRPGIQLAGFIKYFDKTRIQIIGYVEAMYLKEKMFQEKIIIYDRLIKLMAPCYIFCRDIEPDKELLDMATKAQVPIFSTVETTSDFTSTIIKWLGERLSPIVILHGCLVDINGVGVFIQGESGIGKSETVLELLKRGHRMISDDAVKIHKVNENTLLGQAPEMLQDYLEIRGIGIVNVKTMFGVQAIKDTQTIELVVTLKAWNPTYEYDRLGIDNSYTEILGNKVIQYVIPVSPGRNLAVILEAAALSRRQKQLGFYDTESFLHRATLYLNS